MTWTKTHTASQAFVEPSGSDSSSLLACVDEVINTWLPSRGWTTTKASNSPSPTTGHYHWWFTKTIEYLDGSNYEHRQQLVFNNNSANKTWAWEEWADGVAADTQHTYTAFVSAGISSADYQYMTGTWEFWVSDQDDDSFAIISRGTQNWLIGFFPPEGSLIRSSTYTTNNVPTGTCPLVLSPWPTRLFYCGSTGNIIAAMYPGVRADSQSGMGGQEVMINSAIVDASTGSSQRPAFLTGTNDISMVIDTSVNESLTQVGTLQLGSDYYIKIGGSNKLLLHTGTTDPAL